MVNPDIVHVAVEDIPVTLIKEILPLLFHVVMFIMFVNGALLLIRFIMKNSSSDSREEYADKEDEDDDGEWHYTNVGAAVEDSDDDCAYRHEPEPPTVDECAYTHDEVVGKTGRVVKTIDSSGGTIVVRGCGTYNARSLSGEQLRAGKKVEVVSLRNGVAVVSEKI